MNGNKEIARFFICYFASLVEFHKRIVVSRVNNFHAGEIFFNQFPDLQSYSKVNILFSRLVGANSTRILSAVTGIEDDYIKFPVVFFFTGASPVSDFE